MLTLRGEKYRLAQFHFHHQSEHLIDGKYAEMEVHLVHQQLADDKKYAVIGVMIKDGRDQKNNDIKAWWKNLPKNVTHHGQKTGGTTYDFDPAKLLPPRGSSGYFQYEGSLTTPPCTQNVFWTVMETPIFFSSEQIAAFRKMFPNNRRPPQPLEGRSVIRQVP
jgi:carbonic anhydrase